MNKFVVKRHFKMETISVACEFINSNDYLVSVDLLSHAFSASQLMNRIEYFNGLSFQNEFQKSQVDPVTRLTYLGLILDSSTITISLPEEKIENFSSVLGYINNMSSEETKIVFTDVQGLKTSRPLRVMIPKVLRNLSFALIFFY